MDKEPDEQMGPGESVTASGFVRNFGVWQERALVAPVYILHHGRPRLVLTSLDALRQAKSHSDDASHWQIEREAVFEAIDDMVIVTDDHGRVQNISREARIYFGLASGSGQLLASLFPAPAHPIVEGALDRIARTGLGETIEVRAGPFRDRRLELNMHRCDGGVMTVIRDRSLVEERALATAQVLAIQTATSELGNIGIARIGQRGYIDLVSPSFSRLTGLEEVSLLGARFVTLVEIGSRVSVGEALEDVLRHGETRIVSARLMTNHGDPAPVRIAMSPMLDYVLAMVSGAPESFAAG